MEVVNITKNGLKKLKKVSLGYGILNTEADLFIMKTKDKWNIEYKMLKTLFCTEGANFSNKLFTINELIDNRSVININELVLPEKLLIVDGQVNGFIMPYIENTNFEEILNDINISNLQKIEYFKQISHILHKMDNLRNNSDITDLYCYTMTLMNFLFKGRIGSLGRDKYYLYLEYLRSINYPYELLDKLSKIYEYVDNEEIGDELDLLTNDMIVMAQSKIFNMKTKKLGN